MEFALSVDRLLVRLFESRLEPILAHQLRFKNRLRMQFDPWENSLKL
jgi:hypothetical protein